MHRRYDTSIEELFRFLNFNYGLGGVVKHVKHAECEFDVREDVKTVAGEAKNNVGEEEDAKCQDECAHGNWKL